jgi:hypothetical protein
VIAGHALIYDPHLFIADIWDVVTIPFRIIAIHNAGTIDEPCREEGCGRRRLKYSVYCKRHHRQMVAPLIPVATLLFVARYPTNNRVHRSTRIERFEVDNLSRVPGMRDVMAAKDEHTW